MKRSKVLVLMLIASVILNITCFLPYIGGYYDRFKEKIFPTQYFKSNTIDSVVINAVVEASLKMDGSKFETRHPSLGLVPDVKLFLTNGEIHPSDELDGGRFWSPDEIKQVFIFE